MFTGRENSNKYPRMLEHRSTSQNAVLKLLVHSMIILNNKLIQKKRFELKRI